MRYWKAYLLDTTLVAVSPFIAFFVRNNFEWSDSAIHSIYFYAFLGTIIAAVCFPALRIHQLMWRFASLSDISRIILAITIVSSISLVVTFGVNRLEGMARSLPIIQWGILLTTIIGSRLIVRALPLSHKTKSLSNRSRSDLYSKESVVIIGLSRVSDLYIKCVDEIASEFISIAGILDEAPSNLGHSLRSKKVIGQPKDLENIILKYKEHGVNIYRVIMALPFNDLSEIAQTELRSLEDRKEIDIDHFEERLGLASVRNDVDLPVESHEMHRNGVHLQSNQAKLKPTTRSYQYLKFSLDVVSSAVALFILFPLILLISVLVAIDVGLPITFWQQRPGKNGRPFNMYKFRTMAAAFTQNGKHLSDQQRLSSLGKFLRRSRLDELPQLYNILVGDMSFVGPRPLLPVDQPFAIAERLSVRPGLTGLAQISGGKSVPVKDKMMMDLWYVDHASLWLDLNIVLKTPVFLFFGEDQDTYAFRSTKKSETRAIYERTNLSSIGESWLNALPILSRRKEVIGKTSSRYNPHDRDL